MQTPVSAAHHRLRKVASAIAQSHPAWSVALCAFLVLLVAAGLRSSPSVLIVPIEREFGWPRSTISLAIGVNLLMTGLIGPFAAAIFERYGLRLTVSASLAVIAAGVGLTPLVTRSWQLVALWGFVVGTASGATALVLASAIAARWFERRRGLVMGLLTASSATGQLAFLPALAALAEHTGWRSVCIAVAAAAVMLLVPVRRWLRDRPADLGIPPFGGERVVPGPTSTADPFKRALLALKTGIGSTDFLLLAGSFFICGATTNGLVGTHLIPACVDHGFTEVAGAGLLAAMGAFDIVGTTLSGWLSDRYDSRMLLCWYYGLRGLSLIALPFAFNAGIGGFTFAGLGLFAVFYGLDWIATVPPTVRLAARSFGETNVPVMYAWIAAAHQLGAAFAAWLAGVIRTGSGSYTSAFIGAGVLCFVASIMASLIGGRARDPVFKQEAL